MTYAVARISTLGEGAGVASQLARFDAAHAAQAGYRGTLSVDLDDRRQLVVNLWADEESARVARAALRDAVTRVLEPVLAEPSQFLGAGPAHLQKPPGLPEPGPHRPGDQPG